MEKVPAKIRTQIEESPHCQASAQGIGTRHHLRSNKRIPVRRLDAKMANSGQNIYCQEPVSILRHQLSKNHYIRGVSSPPILISQLPATQKTSSKIQIHSPASPLLLSLKKHPHFPLSRTSTPSVTTTQPITKFIPNLESL